MPGTSPLSSAFRLLPPVNLRSEALLSSVSIAFPKGEAADFIRDLKARVASHFESTGKSQKGNAGMWLKTAVLLTLVFAPYAAIMLGHLSGLAMLGLSVVMGVGVAGVGFSVAHDALHGAYSDNQKVNSLLGRSFDILGASSYMWKITHNVIHHTYTNIEGIDEDIDFGPFLRFSPHGKYYRFHRFQHLYAILSYSVATLYWVFAKDYKYFLKKDLGPYRDKKHPPHEIAILVASKVFYYGWAIVLPLLVLDIAWWQFLIGYLVVNMTAGIILGVVFQLAHVVEGTEYPMPSAAGTMEHTWLVHEMITTSNFAPGNRLLSWYVGGLNYQIEHHLFPKICSIHYPEISAIVRDVAEQHGIPYNSQPTMLAAVRSHLRTLKRFGSAAVLMPAGTVPVGGAIEA